MEGVKSTDDRFVSQDGGSDNSALKIDRLPQSRSAARASSVVAHVAQDKLNQRRSDLNPAGGGGGTKEFLVQRFIMKGNGTDKPVFVIHRNYVVTQDKSDVAEKPEACASLTPRLQKIDARIRSWTAEIEKLGEVNYTNYEEILNLRGLIAAYEGLKKASLVELPDSSAEYKYLPDIIKMQRQKKKETNNIYMDFFLRKKEIRQAEVDRLKKIAEDELKDLNNSITRKDIERKLYLRRYIVGLDMLKLQDGPLRPIDRFESLPPKIQQKARIATML
ncbi:MAG: hypothetical protein S4CHLAM20_12250 [Chlamydiia bacterium]|nr:hypothetical protein [Chlamydiia bacterium]